MSLSLDNIASYLLGRGLIPIDWVVDGPLTITGSARRFRNFRVTGPDGAGLFLKQPHALTRGDLDRLGYEAAFHRFCWDEPTLQPVAQHVPPLVDLDVREAVLVSRLIADSTDLRIAWESPDRRDSVLQASLELGSTLGKLHRLFGSILREENSRLSWLSQGIPWAMTAHRPGMWMLADLSPAGLAVLRIVQSQEGISDRLDSLLTRWLPQAVIHGDVRFDNVLIGPGRAGDGPVDLWVIDWELVQIGDPAWDLAGALHDFLVVWVESMPLSEAQAPEDLIARARIPLASLRPASRALWSGYRREAGLDPAETDRLITRAVSFSAARLIQSALEAAIWADELPRLSVLLLQLAANVLAGPGPALAQYYGIPMGDPRS